MNISRGFARDEQNTRLVGWELGLGDWQCHEKLSVIWRRVFSLLVGEPVLSVVEGGQGEGTMGYVPICVQCGQAAPPWLDAPASLLGNSTLS